MPITSAKELVVSMLSELRHGAERSQTIYRELGEAAQSPHIKEALEARGIISSQMVTRLDDCFKILGEKPTKVNQHLHEVFLEDFRRDLNEIQLPLARKLYILAKANHLVHLQTAMYKVLIELADTHGHPGVGVLLESCLADSLTFTERTRRLVHEHIEQRASAA